MCSFIYYNDIETTVRFREKCWPTEAKGSEDLKVQRNRSGYAGNEKRNRFNLYFNNIWELILHTIAASSKIAVRILSKSVPVVPCFGLSMAEPRFCATCKREFLRTTLKDKNCQQILQFVVYHTKTKIPLLIWWY